MTLETTIKIKAYSEDEAKNIIESYKAESNTHGYIIKKAGYARKDKKSKGEIIATAFEVTIVQVFGGFWDDLIE